MVDFATYVRSRMDELDWSLRRTAQESDVSHGALSNWLAGKARPNTDGVRRLARGLRLDEETLLRLAGHLKTTPHDERHPTVEYLAERLDTLPPPIREAAVEALSAQLDAIYHVMQYAIQRPSATVAAVRTLRPDRFPPQAEETAPAQAELAELADEIATMAANEQEGRRLMAEALDALAEADYEAYRQYVRERAAEILTRRQGSVQPAPVAPDRDEA